MNSYLLIFMAVGLVFSFFFSGMEAGVFALSRVRIRRLVRSDNANARRLHRYLENPEDFLWTILAGNTLANFSVASLAVISTHGWMRQHPVWFAVVFFLGALLFYALCELLPKMLFRLYPNRLCLLLSRPFSLMHFLLRPLVAFPFFASVCSGASLAPLPYNSGRAPNRPLKSLSPSGYTASHQIGLKP